MEQYTENIKVGSGKTLQGLFRKIDLNAEVSSIYLLEIR